MPATPKKRRRAGRHTNVFVQESAPSGREELADSGLLDDVEDEAAPDSSEAQLAVATSRTRKLRAQRVARQTRARSEVFTRSIGKELRKLGVLAGGIAVILVVLTFTL